MNMIKNVLYSTKINFNTHFNKYSGIVKFELFQKNQF